MLVGLFDQAKRDAHMSQVSVNAVIACIGLVGQAARDMSIPSDERQTALSTMTVFTGQLVGINRDNRDGWVKLGQAINFGSAENSISALRKLR